MDLTNKVTLMTGAGEGIGRAAALPLSECGAKVAAHGRTRAWPNRWRRLFYSSPRPGHLTGTETWIDGGESLRQG